MSWLFKGAAHAQLYLKYRPVYPPSVYTTILDYLADGVAPAARPRPKLAVDVGCGSGQSTLALAALCESVVGVDVSEAQLDEARQASVGHANVTYRAAEGHDLAFAPDGGVDLVTVAQAMHWLDATKFYTECRRVLKKGGVLAVYGYGTPKIDHPDAQVVLSRFYSGTLRGYWEPGRRHIDDCYAELYREFSTAFKKCIKKDSLALKKDYSVDEFVGYLLSWSAYQTYRKKHPSDPDPIQQIHKEFERIYSDHPKQQPMHVVSPIFMLLAKHT